MSVWPGSADGGGLGVGARREIGVARLHAELAKAAVDDGDVDGAKQHAEHVVNILEGASGENFVDLDGNGTAQNPGDGFGALLYVADAGKHAGFAAAADDADAEVLLHGQHVVDCQANVGTWGTGAREKALDVLRPQTRPWRRCHGRDGHVHGDG